jgi:hypothetical protein
MAPKALFTCLPHLMKAKAATLPGPEMQDIYCRVHTLAAEMHHAQFCIYVCTSALNFPVHANRWSDDLYPLSCKLILIDNNSVQWASITCIPMLTPE